MEVIKDVPLFALAYGSWAQSTAASPAHHACMQPSHAAMPCCSPLEYGGYRSPRSLQLCSVHDCQGAVPTMRHNRHVHAGCITRWPALTLCHEVLQLVKGERTVHGHLASTRLGAVKRSPMLHAAGKKMSKQKCKDLMHRQLKK